jgi:hypothetical protein
VADDAQAEGCEDHDSDDQEQENEGDWVHGRGSGILLE